MSSSLPRMSRAEQRQQTQRRILAAARQAFSEYGYDRTTIRAIASAAGVNPGLVMHYFGAKEHLFAQASETWPDEPGLSTSQPVPEQLLAALQAKLTEEPIGTLAMLRSMLTHPEATEGVREMLARQQRQLSEVIPTDDALLRTGLSGAITLGVLIGRYLLQLDGLRDAPPERIAGLLRPCLQSLTDVGADPLYPAVEPYDEGMLDVGDGHLVYWEVCGNPEGKPAVVLHGGPGSGCTPGWRRFFDPGAYRIVLFDQRGCGRSRPHASEPAADLSTNTTAHLIEDIERLRRHLGIERWLVFGGSWGSTLALAYAERHPARVSEAVFFSITTTTHREVEWVTRDMGRVFPAAWARFRDGVPAAERDGNLAEAYSRLLHDSDPEVREKAAKDWCGWEDTHVAVRANHRPDPRYQDPAFRMAFARLVTHYWRHAAWLEDGSLLRDAPRLAGVPGVIVHGRMDVSGPPDVAWELAQAWPAAELVFVDDAGHGAGDPGMAEALGAATDRFAAR